MKLNNVPVCNADLIRLVYMGGVCRDSFEFVETNFIKSG